MIARRPIVVFAAVLVAVAGPLAGVAYAEPVKLTDHQIAAMAPAEQAKLLNPLRALANAADSVGRAGATDIYSGVEIDAPERAVNVYITDLNRADAFLAAAKKADNKIDLRLARVKQSHYTKRALEDARDRALRTPLGFTVDSAVVPPDGSALRLRAADVDRARQALGRSVAGQARTQGESKVGVIMGGRRRGAGGSWSGRPRCVPPSV